LPWHYQYSNVIRMNLRTYVERNGQKLAKAHPELQRLAQAAKLTPYTLYMVALGHKTLGARKAMALSAASDGCVDLGSVCPAVFGLSAPALIPETN
jgi:hypothetical protein